jgi:predicted glycosyltransferase
VKFLFFFVHPSKFHVFRPTINALKDRGHEIEVLITSKDVLEDLVRSEKWRWTNIFPEGRKMNGVSPYISSTINLFRTIWRLYLHTKNKKYDLFITDDLLVYIGKLKKVPTIVFNDDDIQVVKQFAIIMAMADHILAPDITDLGRYNKKKIGFPSYKELAYLHPNYFVPDKSVLLEFNPNQKKYSIIRVVSLRAYHDVGKKGLTDIQILEIIGILEIVGDVFIVAERPLPNSLEKYRIKLSPEKILHALAFAEIFVGDSQTMTSEATILGVPSFRCNDFVGRISVVDEKETRYQLSFNFVTKDYSKMIEKLSDFVSHSGFKSSFQKKREKLISEKIDLTKFMIWYFENYHNIDGYSGQY